MEIETLAELIREILIRREKGEYSYQDAEESEEKEMISVDLPEDIALWVNSHTHIFLRDIMNRDKV